MKTAVKKRRQETELTDLEKAMGGNVLKAPGRGEGERRRFVFTDLFEKTLEGYLKRMCPLAVSLLKLGIRSGLTRSGDFWQGPSGGFVALGVSRALAIAAGVSSPALSRASGSRKAPMTSTR